MYPYLITNKPPTIEKMIVKNKMVKISKMDKVSLSKEKLEKQLRLSIYNLIEVSTEMLNLDGDDENLSSISDTIETLDNIYCKLYPNEYSPIVAVIVSENK
jgi:hypothetical protein